MRDVVIASACRTPIGKFQGGLRSFRAQLGQGTAPPDQLAAPPQVAQAVGLAAGETVTIEPVG